MKIRLAVAVAADGSWEAWGHQGVADALMAENALSQMHRYGKDPTCSRLVHFVEADVPLPAQAETIKGSVRDVPHAERRYQTR